MKKNLMMLLGSLLVISSSVANSGVPATYTSIKNNALLSQIWNGFIRSYDSESSNRYMEINGKIIKKGTVRPIGSSVKGRLPAYLVCYHYIQIFSMTGGDAETDTCVYYIDNPSRGTYRVMWRGEAKELQSAMNENGFISDK